MRVFVTGFMGAGKTTVGRLLAARLDLPFVDLDAEIERQAGRSAAGIFAAGGEREFRQLESRALERAIAGPEAVIATGGGTVVAAANLEAMRSAGVVVWLDPPFDVLMSRLAASGGERPLLGGRTQTLALFHRRLDAYRRAHHRIDVGAGEAAERVAARVAAVVGKTPCAT